MSQHTPITTHTPLNTHTHILPHSPYHTPSTTHTHPTPLSLPHTHLLPHSPYPTLPTTHPLPHTSYPTLPTTHTPYPIPLTNNTSLPHTGRAQNKWLFFFSPSKKKMALVLSRFGILQKLALPLMGPSSPVLGPSSNKLQTNSFCREQGHTALGDHLFSMWSVCDPLRGRLYPFARPVEQVLEVFVEQAHLPAWVEGHSVPAGEPGWDGNNASGYKTKLIEMACARACVRVYLWVSLR